MVNNLTKHLDKLFRYPKMARSEIFSYPTEPILVMDDLWLTIRLPEYFFLKKKSKWGWGYLALIVT